MNKMILIGACAVLTALNFAANAQETEVANPKDNFYTRYMHTEKQPLAYDYIHEKDVFWEKRIWREIDTRVKRNQHFTYPLATFASIILKGAKEGKISAYGTMSDDFSQRLSCKEVNEICASTDTFMTINPETFEEELHTAINNLDESDIKKYRLKEVWFMDEETGRMNVRILGIAPIIDRYDDKGNFLHSAPLFWLYYPELRPLLAQSEAFNIDNDAMRMSWDDVFEARLFDSQITKSSNVHDTRLQDTYSGIDILLAAQKVNDEVFHFEHDLWEY